MLSFALAPPSSRLPQSGRCLNRRDAIPATVDNFMRTKSDRALAGIAAQGGFGKFLNEGRPVRRPGNRQSSITLQSPRFCFSFSIAWSMVKLAGRWLGGYSLNVARNLATTAWAPRAM
jgi:hypothetical protein